MAPDPPTEVAVAMIACPRCMSPRVFVRIDGTGRAWCTTCGWQWLQFGSEQRRIRTVHSPYLEEDGVAAESA